MVFSRSVVSLLLVLMGYLFFLVGFPGLTPSSSSPLFLPELFRTDFLPAYFPDNISLFLPVRVIYYLDKKYPGTVFVPDERNVSFRSTMQIGSSLFKNVSGFSSLSVQGFRVSRVIVVPARERFVFFNGWFPPERWYHGDDRYSFFYAWMGNESSLAYYHTKARTGALLIKGEAYYTLRNLTISVGATSDTFSFPAGKVVTYRLEDVSFPAGDVIVRLSADSCGVPRDLEQKEDRRCISFALYDLRFVPAVFS